MACPAFRCCKGSSARLSTAPLQRPTQISRRALRKCASRSSTAQLVHKHWQCQRAECVLNRLSERCRAGAVDPPTPSTTESSPATLQPPSDAKLSAVELLRTSLRVLRAVAWPTIWLYAFNTFFILVIDRFSNRLQNALFLAIQGGTYTADQIGPLWWTSVSPVVTTFTSGYNYLSYSFMLITMPASIFVVAVAKVALYRLASAALDAPASQSSASKAPPEEKRDVKAPPVESASETKAAKDEPAATSTSKAASSDDRTNQKDSTSKGAISSGQQEPAASQKADKTEAAAKSSSGIFASLRKALASIRQVLRDDIKTVYKTNFMVYVLARVWFLLSTPVLSAPWTLPRFVGLQLAPILALYRGQNHKEALETSKEWLADRRRPMGLALGLVYAMEMLATPISTLVLAAFPPRIVMQVPELVVLVLLVAQLLSFCAIQIRHLLPLIMYRCMNGDRFDMSAA